jgi:NADH dehydrogenase
VKLPYDSLIVAAGVGGSYFGHDEFEQWAPGMKTLSDALAQRGRIFGAFELAELEEDPEARKALLTFAVVGGGPTGVEIAGQIAELSRRALKGNFRNFDPKSVRVVLFDGGKEILANFGDKLSGKATSELEQTGVEIHTESIVTSVDADGVEVKGPDGEITRFAARTTIWAAGVQASPLAKMLAEKTGAETDRPGRVSVNPDCSLPGHPEVFAIGDMVLLNKLPGVAQPAMQEGKYVGKLIAARLTGAPPPPPFKYFDKGSMATIGHKAAVADAFGRKFTGFIAYIMWGFIHVLYLVGWGNRLGTMYTWARAIWFSNNRGHRIITFERTMVELDENRKKGRAPVVLPGSNPSLADQLDAVEGAPVLTQDAEKAS